ncbi:Dihydrofolate reductase [Seinonella peptonophila]|uniref:Dihydrofolate reductase n=1 Tax=Seinonella peptonophila TaxID=112248 RepID=A0A1M4Y6L3_9BACL|nr:dihydrofolate reductase family protein [Seinonella peptonophila]SHF01213.1 Dihydrofolate reductase [Seinonella peptonophila]
MRKIILYMHTSLDGCVEGSTDWDLNWIPYDHALEKYANEILKKVDTVLWGRSTFLGMQNFWTSVPDNPKSSQHEINHAKWLENTTKIAFSRTLDQVDWKNSRLIKEDLEAEVLKLKQQAGQDMVILGSPRFAQSLMKYDLIDEYRLTISPVVLGNQKVLFNDLEDPLPLQLTDSRVFDSGVIAVTYQRVRND